MLKAVVTMVRVMGNMQVVKLTILDLSKRHKKAEMSSSNMSNLAKINVWLLVNHTLFGLKKGAKFGGKLGPGGHNFDFMHMSFFRKLGQL